MALTRGRTTDGVPVLAVVGDIDLQSASALNAELDAHLSSAGPLVVLDLRGIDFIDSAGLKVLDDAERRAVGSGTQLALVCTQQRVLRLLSITGLDSRFAVYTSPEAAVRPGGSGG